MGPYAGGRMGPYARVAYGPIRVAYGPIRVAYGSARMGARRMAAAYGRTAYGRRVWAHTRPRMGPYGRAYGRIRAFGVLVWGGTAYGHAYGPPCGRMGPYAPPPPWAHTPKRPALTASLPVGRGGCSSTPLVKRVRTHTMRAREHVFNARAPRAPALQAAAATARWLGPAQPCARRRWGTPRGWWAPARGRPLRQTPSPRPG